MKNLAAINHNFTAVARKKSDLPLKKTTSVWLPIIEDFLNSDDEARELIFEEGARAKVAIYTMKEQVKNRHLPMEATRRGDSIWLIKSDSDKGK